MSAHIIKQIVRMVEGKYETIVRTRCPFCRVNYSLLLVSRTSRYECQACHKNGKLSDLLVYFEDEFEHRHKKTISNMTERSAVDL